MDEIGDRIKGFIRDEILYGDGAALSDDTPLLDGLMDSLGLMELVSFLEGEFDIELDEGDIVTDRFRTVGSVEQLVRQKLG